MSDYRRILIAINSPVISELITRQLYAEFEDVEPLVVLRAREATDLINHHTLDLIICQKEFDETGVDGMMKTQRESSLNRFTPIIVVTADGSAGLRNQYNHLLQIPFDSHQLRRLVLAASDEREYRVNERYHIDGARCELRFGEREWQGSAVNISRCGALLEFCVLEIDSLGLGRNDLRLVIPGIQGEAWIEGIEARLVKLQVVERLADGRTRLRTGWRFDAIPEEQEDKLYALLMLVEHSHRGQEAKAMAALNDSGVILPSKGIAEEVWREY